jgi:cytochrome c2
VWFALSHFSMLVVLLSMMIIGLAMRGIRRYPPPSTWYVHGGDAERGRLVLESHGCGGCHSIAGIRGATGNVGPPLEGFAQRMYIGGQLPNTPDNLIAWLQNPQRYAPGTAMPNMPITEPVARDMAAYLYARR